MLELLVLSFANFDASVHFILEALKDQISLRILEFLDLLLLFQFVVLHGGGDIVGIGRVLGMEHVGAEVEHCLLVAALLIGLTDLPLAELFDKLRNAVDEVACVNTV